MVHILTTLVYFLPKSGCISDVKSQQHRLDIWKNIPLNFLHALNKHPTYKPCIEKKKIDGNTFSLIWFINSFAYD